jgi:hypothetical protein
MFAPLDVVPVAPAVVLPVARDPFLLRSALPLPWPFTPALLEPVVSLAPIGPADAPPIAPPVVEPGARDDPFFSALPLPCALTPALLEPVVSFTPVAPVAEPAVPAPLLCAKAEVESANTPSRRSELRNFIESPLVVGTHSNDANGMPRWCTTARFLSGAAEESPMRRQSATGTAISDVDSKKRRQKGAVEHAQHKNWWRRRESNSRPQAFHSQDYMLSLVIWISPRARQPAGWRSASRFDGSTRLSDQAMQRG